MVCDLPGVGRNLQDHLNTSLKYACKKPITLYNAMRFPGNLLIGLEYLLFKTGAGATMHTEAGAFMRAGDGPGPPDIQHHFIPILVYDNGRRPPDQHGFQCHVCPVRPETRGRLSLRSTDPTAAPVLQPDYLAAAGDLRLMRQSVKLTREVFAQPAMAPYCGPELAPGPAVRSDQEIDAYLRQSSVTCYHPAGTCKMGRDETAVVDAELKVHGLEGLRVVDASVMPELVSGNTNAAIMMIAERTAERILGRVPAPPEDVEIDGYQPIRSEALRERAA